MHGDIACAASVKHSAAAEAAYVVPTLTLSSRLITIR